MLTPRALGGSEVDARSFVLVIERLARAEASSAWCAFISSTTALIAGYLPPEHAREVFARPDLRLAGVFAPGGKARPAEHEGVRGFRVSGAWSWGSGTANAEHILGGCLVIGEDGRPQTLADGTVDVRSMLFDASQVTRADNWTAMGLRGTGSGQFSVRDAFVPLSRSASVLSGTPLPLPLYRFPIFCLLAVGIAAVALGVARLSIDSLVGLSQQKTPQGSQRKLAERPSTQQHVARAEARLRAARAFLLEAVEAAWAAATADALPLALRRDLRLATTHAAEEAAAVAQSMYACGGGDAIFEASPLQRCLRDIQVAGQHIMVNEATYELTGRLFLGLSTQVAML